MKNESINSYYCTLFIMSKISAMIVLTALAIGLFSLSVDPIAIFAQTGSNTTTTSTGTSTNISIVAGASAPNNPKFYDPSPANIAVGTTVTWTNNDATLHTVYSGSPDDAANSGKLFKSDFMAKGKTFSHTFDTAGTFDYYCTLHPFMIGQVVVK
jgi:plastocyanin